MWKYLDFSSGLFALDIYSNYDSIELIIMLQYKVFITMEYKN